MGLQRVGHDWTTNTFIKMLLLEEAEGKVHGSLCTIFPTYCESKLLSPQIKLYIKLLTQCLTYFRNLYMVG